MASPPLSPLAKIVVAGHELAEPVRVADSIYLSPDITSSFLIVTDEGNAIVNTGATGNGATHKARYAAISQAPTAFIFLTQSHLDHVGGVEDLRGASTKVITQARFPEIMRSRRQLAPYWQRRKDQLLKSLLGDRMVTEFIDPVVPDLTVDDTLDLSLGGRRFTLISVPGGETLDSMAVWLPDERILFTGNMFGPIIGDLPNLYTIRGERIRSAQGFVHSIERVMALEPELVIQGHGLDSQLDAATFQAKAGRVRDAVLWLHDAVIAGMNEGRTIHQLMREITLPPELDVPVHHGKVAWCVRAIWEEYAGWFYASSTTELYDVPVSDLYPQLAELAGGADVLVGQARARLRAGETIAALHLAEIALAASPGDRGARQVELEAHERLLDDSGKVNFFETLWLQSQIDETRDSLG